MPTGSCSTARTATSSSVSGAEPVPATRRRDTDTPAAAALILVNHNTADHARQAVEALRRQGLDLELVVVDNASQSADRDRLRGLADVARIVWNDSNLGYGEAVNRALPLTTAPVVGFLNPDIRPFPDALARLLAVLEADRSAGAVAPRMWWDDERRFLLPPVRLPTLEDFAARALGRLVPAAGHTYSRRLARRAERVGFGERRRPLPMLSGGFLLTRRTVIREVGGFDPRFPLYFEDADWCRRVRRAGHRLVYVPAAEIVHYFDQSARQNVAQAEAWRAHSRAAYLRKYYGRTGLAFVEALEAVARRAERRPPRRIVNLGACGEPPRLRLPAGTGAVQLAYHWLFYDAAVGRAAEGEWRLPDSLWGRLRPARYYVRAVAPATWRTVAAWSWAKAS